MPLKAALRVHLFQAADLRADIRVLIPVPAVPQCQVDRLPLHQPSPSANESCQGLDLHENSCRCWVRSPAQWLLKADATQTRMLAFC